ncbi:MAG: polysaccharide biosynthesis protein CapD [Labilithrix sp.]|nr:polysaccharide biosynthesis protein CapD [Labilithrix sp.]
MRDVIIAYRRVLVVAMHLALWTASFFVAVLLRFEFAIPAAFLTLAPRLLLVSLTVRTLVHWRFGLFHGLWRYSSSRDLVSLIKAATLSSAIIATAWAFAASGTFPRSIFVLDFAFSILIIGGLRLGIRTIHEVGQQSNSRGPASQDGKPAGGPEPRRRIVVLGAGDAGETLMREIVRSHGRRFDAVGFLDDSPRKQGERIHGVPVLGPIAEVANVIEKQRIDEVILAIPSLRGKEIRRVVELCRPTGVTLRTVPGLDALIDGTVTVSQLSEVKIEDLLGREPVKLDTRAIGAFLAGRVVLVTGAGGSIGSELCHQIARFGPAKLILLEQAENNLFEVHRALLRVYPDVVTVPSIADVCDTKRLDAIFDAHRPDVVFHAAAHKHVPMMEANPGEAIKNNVFGTKKVADLAARYQVKTFVMVSTDKAVNPTSVMGASKRTAEIYVQALSQRTETQFVTVRFGNVLGSAGSVIPIFKQQIAAGGPVTVTHPDMKRYFMTIPEACQLILQAGAMGRGGEIFILDMGEPVKIVDLARDLIRLSGLTPDEDIAIAFSGMRPGEKLFEELSFDAEKAEKTGHEKIFVGNFRPHAWEEIQERLEELHQASDGSSGERVREAFRKMVPEYSPELLSPSSLVPPVQEVAKAKVVQDEPARPSSPAVDRISAPAL